MKKQLIDFVRSQEPITEAVTKFGGVPVRVAAPQWPLSRESGEPMHFIAQIAIEPELFGGEPGRMAYLFMSGDEDGDGTWEPDGGENALIIQPGDAALAVQTAPLREGPSIFEMVFPVPHHLGVQSPCEFATRLSETVEDGGRSGEEHSFDNQIGGAPVWMQGDETPGEGWRRAKAGACFCSLIRRACLSGSTSATQAWATPSYRPMARAACSSGSAGEVHVSTQSKTPLKLERGPTYYTLFQDALRAITVAEAGDVGAFIQTLEDRIRSGRIMGTPPGPELPPEVQPPLELDEEAAI